MRDRAGAQSQLWTAHSVRSFSAARAGSPRSSSGESTSGFSQSTWSERLSAARTRCACEAGGVQMSTKSISSFARSSSALSYHRASGKRSSSSALRSCRESAPATIVASSRARQPGRWPPTATWPTPRSAPLSMGRDTE